MTIGAGLAWRQIAKEKRRLAAATAGIAFAVILMLVQLGFEQALFKSVSRLYASLNVELVLISPKYSNVGAASVFSRRRLDQALAHPQVDWALPLYIDDLRWKNPVDHTERYLFILAFEPRPGVFDLPGVNERLADLRQTGTILFDGDSRPEFGPIAEEFRRRGRFPVEVSGKTATVAGIFHLGTSFQADGNVIASDVTLARLRDRSLDLATLGLVKLKPGADAAAAQLALRASLPADVLVLTRDELTDREVEYWARNTPIGFVFRLGLIMGLVVGSVVVYQILYNDVSEHLAEYATLKAMGYRDRFLFGVVIKESLILSLLGFVPGLVLSEVTFLIAKRATLLPLQMEPVRVLFVYLLTAGMCVLSGALAMRRLKHADPAEIF